MKFQSSFASSLLDGSDVILSSVSDKACIAQSSENSSQAICFKESKCYSVDKAKLPTAAPSSDNDIVLCFTEPMDYKVTTQRN